MGAKQSRGHNCAHEISDLRPRVTCERSPKKVHNSNIWSILSISNFMLITCFDSEKYAYHLFRFRKIGINDISKKNPHRKIPPCTGRSEIWREIVVLKLYGNCRNRPSPCIVMRFFRIFFPKQSMCTVVWMKVYYFFRCFWSTKSCKKSKVFSKLWPRFHFFWRRLPPLDSRSLREMLRHPKQHNIWRSPSLKNSCAHEIWSLCWPLVCMVPGWLRCVPAGSDVVCMVSRRLRCVPAERDVYMVSGRFVCLPGGTCSRKKE